MRRRPLDAARLCATSPDVKADRRVAAAKASTGAHSGQTWTPRTSESCRRHSQSSVRRRRAPSESVMEQPSPTTYAASKPRRSAITSTSGAGEAPRRERPPRGGRPTRLWRGKRVRVGPEPAHVRDQYPVIRGEGKPATTERAPLSTREKVMGGPSELTWPNVAHPVVLQPVSRAARDLRRRIAVWGSAAFSTQTGLKANCLVAPFDVAWRQRRPSLDGSGSSTPENQWERLGGKTEAGADHAEVGGSEQLSARDILHDKERTTEDSIGQLASLRLELRRPDRRFGGADSSNHLLKLGGLEGECRIDSAHAAAQGDVFLDDARAQGHAGDRHLAAERAVGEANDAPELPAERGNGREVHLLGPRRVRAHAVQHGDIPGARGRQGPDGESHFLERCHASRQDDRLAGGADAPQELQIDDLEGSDLVRGYPQPFEKIHSALVERRREQRYPVFRRDPLELRVPRPWCVGLLVELVERLPLPFAIGALDAKPLVVAVDGEGVCGVRLELDGVDARSTRGLDDPGGKGETLVVIPRQLRDDVTRIPCPDGPAGDLEASRHVLGHFREPYGERARVPRRPGSECPILDGRERAGRGRGPSCDGRCPRTARAARGRARRRAPATTFGAASECERGASRRTCGAYRSHRSSRAPGR